MSDPLRDLQRRLESAQTAPPQLANSKRSIQIPQVMRPPMDSRGQRRPVMRTNNAQLERQITKAKGEMMSLAERELIAKAKEQLKP